MPHAPDLRPGLMVIHGNHPEALRDLMLAWMQRYPLQPLEDELVLVQSNGIAQWLKLSLARPVGEGGCGIAAALQTQLPSRFIWQAYRAVLGVEQVPPESPFDRPRLVWRLMRLLPGLLADPSFAPLQRFLADDADRRKRYQLAERLADLFDQYQVYRADWLADWGAGRPQLITSRQGVVPVPDEMAWQPRLWQALLQDVAPDAAASSRALVHQRFLAAVQAGTGARPAGLPRRVIVFGISSLPQQSLEVLAALARWCQVLMCVHNPCEHDWSQIVADQDLLRAQRHRQRARPGAALAASPGQGHPLLAAWGKQGRDFIRLLDQHDEREAYERRFTAIGQRIDHFEPNAQDTLLRQLQDDVRDLRPLHESRSRWPAVDEHDWSIRFHDCHGPQREVEVLHDQLLAAFAADPTLQPRDVIVMVPDIAGFAPHVQAVFGLLPPGDPRHIPFTLADGAGRRHDPMREAVAQLLTLPQARVAVSEVLSLLEVPALRQRFGIDEAQLPLLHRWLRAANVRWGLHAEQRGSLGLPEQAHNTWDFGLQRMLLGYAAGDGEPWQGIAPLDEVGGLEAEALGPLLQLAQALQLHWQQLATPATPGQWGERLRALLAAFFVEDHGAGGLTRLRLETALADWLQACEDAGFDEPLPLAVVREHWLAQLDDSGLEQPFFGGGVTFATLLPMRAIPFRFVALLGMNDGDFPRSRVPTDFDLMARDWRPGDRSRREDDRYMFLEALLSARERLHASWVGRSIHDQSERAPSVLVAQLRDHLAAGWRLTGDEALPQAKAGQRLLAALKVQHRLQPFHPAYFTQGGDARLFSYAREWQAGLQAPAAAPSAELAPLPLDGPLTLQLLGDFLKDPARSFLRLRLGVHFHADDPVCEDEEPFQLDGLQQWQLQDELVQAQRAALAAGQDRQAALSRQLHRIAERGALPAGNFGLLAQDALAEPMERMFSDYQAALATWPQALPDEPLDHLPQGLPEALRLADWLTGLRDAEEGSRCRLVLTSTALMGNEPGKPRTRHDKLLPHWVAHVAAHLDGPPLASRIIGKNGFVDLRPLAREAARAYWQRLLDAWQQGLQRPLPLAPCTGFAWLQARADPKLAELGEPTAQAKALDKARACYDPAYASDGEVGHSAYLARAFPCFRDLWAQGEFARWAEALLQPLRDAVLHGPRKEAP